MLDGIETNSKKRHEKKTNSGLPDDTIIIAGKPIQNYAFSILLLFEDRKEIKLYANLNHTPVMERLISLYKVHGIEEMDRTRTGNRIKVILARR